MALTTIGYIGYGVVANGDADTNDTGGSATGDWGELGGGTIGANPDVYLFSGGTPQGSQGSKYASKSGYSYISGITALDFTGVSGNAEDNLVYMWVNLLSPGPLDTLANDGCSAAIGSGTGAMDHWKIASKTDSNGYTGGWKCFVIDPQITPSVDNSAVLTSVSFLGLWIDTDVSVRADSIFQGQIFAAKGVYCTGTSTVDEGLDELAFWCTDYANRAFGAIEVRGSTYYLKGTIEIGDGTVTTVFTAAGNSLECEESSFHNGTSWVSSMPTTVNNLTVLANASMDLTNCNIAGFIDNKLALDTSAGDDCTIVGGSLKLLRALTVQVNDVFSGVVFSTNDALSLGAASYDDCSFVLCGTQTIGSTASFSGNTFQPAEDVTALSCDDLADIVDGTFVYGGGGHAVELTGTIGSNTAMAWDATLDNAAWTTTAQLFSGIQGDVDDAILVDVANTFTLTINVGAGASIPSVRNTGLGDVDIVAGQTTMTLTPLVANTEIRIYETGTTTSFDSGSQDIENSGVTHDVVYTFAAATFVDIVIHHVDYVYQKLTNIELVAADSNLPVQQFSDRNYSNP
jgi:hypothetical protein